MSNLDYIEHYGVRGMRWGHSKNSVSSNSRSFKKDLKKGLHVKLDRSSKNGIEVKDSLERYKGQAKGYSNKDISRDLTSRGLKDTVAVNKNMLKGYSLRTARTKVNTDKESKAVLSYLGGAAVSAIVGIAAMKRVSKRLNYGRSI